MKRQNIFHEFSLAIIFLFSPCYISAQTWVNNNATDFFEHKIVYNLGFIHDTAWALTNEGLYKYSNGIFNRYAITDSSFGNLDNYLSIPDYYYCTDIDMSIVKNTLWLVQRRAFKILKITGNEIMNLKISKGNIKNYQIDDKNNFYYMSDEFVKSPVNSFIVKYDLFEFSDKGPIDSLYQFISDSIRITDFKVLDDKVFTLKLNLKIPFDYTLEIFSIKENTTKVFPLNENSESTLKMEVIDQGVFVLSSNGKLYEFSDSNFTRDYSVPVSNEEYYFGFQISKAKLYLTNSNGLYIKGISSNDIAMKFFRNEYKDKYTAFMQPILNYNKGQLWITNQLLERGIDPHYYGLSILQLR